ncbi:MAG: hypothetical protein LBP82_01800, partial [Candidatus Methanoplasma sp.]|nr:hypothetical protein [Candidatus Methanoplasma sp.]
MKIKPIKFFSGLFILAAVLTLTAWIAAPVDAADTTYDNLYASVQGETNAAAAYTAFAEKAKADG